MAIRFQCSGCDQPIEVDDQWAGRPVACPYCRQTVTAPRESSPDLEHDIPMASPLSGAGRPGSVPARRNGVAIAGLVLACMSFACVLGASALLRPHMDELSPVLEAIMSAYRDGRGDEAQRLQLDFMTKYGQTGWLGGASMLMLLSIPCWLAGIVCGLLGLRRAGRRSIAVAALVVSGLLPVVMCCGGGM